MRWPHYDHIFFDCDSTLTAVEGIDALADAGGKGWRIGVLTQASMDGQLDLEQIYDKRLRAIRPTRRQIERIRQIYKQHVVEDAAQVVRALQEWGHQVYIISGGLAEPVIQFGLFLGVPRENIRAVQVEYNALSGDWWQHEDLRGREESYLAYEHGDLTVSDGKARIVRDLLGEKRGRSLLVGDGVSDLLAGTAVDLFVGYGGVVSRPRVQEKAPAFIHTPSLAPLLALAAGPGPFRQTSQSPYQPLLDKVVQLISTGAITIQDERLRSKFNEAFSFACPPVHSRPH